MSKRRNTRNPNEDYRRGRKWGFAVMSAAVKSGKSAVARADNAMRTCFRNAKTGTKRLNASERNAYRGMGDGMYDAMKLAERRGK